MLENINKALIYFNRAWALDASDKDCEKAINLLISKNKKRFKKRFYHSPAILSVMWSS